MSEKKITHISVGIALVDDQNIRAVNKEYFNKNHSTDVIAFNLNESVPDGTYILGELIISKPQVSRQAKSYGVSFEEELARVVAHGVLHLTGYTDDTEKARFSMKKIEDRIAEEFTDRENPRRV